MVRRHVQSSGIGRLGRDPGDGICDGAGTQIARRSDRHTEEGSAVNRPIEDSVTPQKASSQAEQFDAQDRMRQLRNYYQWTFSLVKSFVGNRVLDAGCGIGNFTELLLDSCDFVLAADGSRQSLNVMADRFRGRPNLKLLQLDFAKSGWQVVRPHRIDTVVCLDVLEHVEDDVELLRRFHEVTEPEATLILKVPACRSCPCHS